MRELRLTAFRSYAHLDVALAAGVNVLYGPNGAGKTNLLEAVSWLAPGRGLRRARVDEVRARGSDTPWGVAARLETQVGPVALGVGQDPAHSTRRLVRIDGQTATATQLARTLTINWLTPAQDRLFTGPESERRKFLDRFTLTHTPAHGTNTARFEALRAERNRLLGEGLADAAWYRALEADLARYGSLVAAARVNTVELLREEIASRPEGAFPRAEIGLEGFAEDRFSAGASLDEVRLALEAALCDGRREALRARRTLIGPHRTKFHVVHAPKSMPAEACSTGEQKALLIGLVLAHARSHSDASGRWGTPVLLLDEIAAHLDSSRRMGLARELRDLGGQVLLTGTDRNLFEAFESARMMEVRDGEVREA